MQKKITIKEKNKINNFLFFGIAAEQLERDDALTEIQILKEKLEKAQYSLNKAHEERENTTKEFEKMLEKYDR